ncbi:MAG TPA: hypothetical protein VGR28_12810 [Candidatus Thermoplasmatota archaeon]|jgi:hypothetical protein|nr:hypothetical protein [Candidatus Thermoplasmatota archaeon]
MHWFHLVGAMLFGIAFASRPGQEAALEAATQDEALLENAAAAMGATFDALVVKGNQFALLYDFPAVDAMEARQRVLAAFDAPGVQQALRRMAPLLGDPFDPEDATSFAAWVQRHKLRVVQEAHLLPVPPPSEPSKASSGAPALGALPR